MREQFSKPISKDDEGAKLLIIDTLEGLPTGGFDLDSVYCIHEKYYVLEFLKCDTVRPFDSHPKRYWSKNKQKFISLWEITQKLEGELFLVNYEDSREQFKVIKVKDLSAEGILDEEISLWDFEQFKKWFKKLNNLSRESTIDADYQPEKDCFIHEIVQDSSKFVQYLPFYSISAACGGFIDGGIPEEEGWVKVTDFGIKANKNRFIVRAQGNSMLPKVHPGDLCVFERNLGGTRNGLIVLAQSRDFDADYSGKYTIKKYHSEARMTDDWEVHKTIDLVPLNPDYDTIHLSEDDDVAIIGVLVGIIDGNAKPIEKEPVVEEKQGYCIRCQKLIKYSYGDKAPIYYCQECWQKWHRAGDNKLEKEKYCHRCGQEKYARYKNFTCFDYPLCSDCWNIEQEI